LNIAREKAVRRDYYETHAGAMQAAALANYHERRAKCPLYVTWQGIKQRCLNPRTRQYPYYGGRGISVYDRWLTFGAFAADIETTIGPRPPDPAGWKSTRPFYSLDRIDNDSNYEPGNVRWATWQQQAANRRWPRAA